MNYAELPKVWRRIFELEWLSLCKGSKAIAAVIVDELGEIISEGRNMIGERGCPNPIVCHAETEAIRNLNIEKYPETKKYTLYAGLEPCPMCMGTIVMGRIRNVVIAARDDFGGAMKLMEYSPFIRNKNIQVTWLDNELGNMQRAFQTIRELLLNEDKDKLEKMLVDFSVYNKAGVEAAMALVAEGYFQGKVLEDIPVDEVYDELRKRMEKPRIVFHVCECIYGNGQGSILNGAGMETYLKQHGMCISEGEMLLSGRLSEDIRNGDVLYSGDEAVLKVKKIYAYGQEFEDLHAGMTCGILADRTEHLFMEGEWLYDRLCKVE